MNIKDQRARGDLGRRVAYRRAELGLSQEEVAERAGMAAGYIDYLERNPPHLSPGALSRLADALQTTPEALLGVGFDEPLAHTPPGFPGQSSRRSTLSSAWS